MKDTLTLLNALRLAPLAELHVVNNMPPPAQPVPTKMKMPAPAPSFGPEGLGAWVAARLSRFGALSAPQWHHRPGIGLPGAKKKTPIIITKTIAALLTMGALAHAQQGMNSVNQPAPGPSALAAAASMPLPATCYLFAYFVGNGEDGLHFAWSKNGLEWEMLNGGRSYLKPVVGSKIMRDPNLFQGPDGTYHAVWTTGWGGKTIGYAHSRDLIHWDGQKAIPVMEKAAGVLNCWAPEGFYDQPGEQFILYWSSTVPGRFPESDGQGDGKYNHRIYYVTTKDFETFSDPRILFDPGYNVIDGTLLRREGKVYLVFKDERPKPRRKVLLTAVADSATGPFQVVSEPFTKPSAEGPTLLETGGEVYCYYDFSGSGYGVSKSKDMIHWQDIASQLKMPKGMRHGTVLAVPGPVIMSMTDIDSVQAR